MKPLRLSLQNITHRFGSLLLFQKLDLSLFSGDCLLLTGENGSGKTTLLRIAATLLKPSAGEIFVDGFSSYTHLGEVRKLIGVIFHEPMVYQELTGREYLNFVRALFLCAGDGEEVLRRVGLFSFADQKIGTYSRGMIQRLALARISLQSPSLLLLDEPCTGLDTAGMALQVEILKEALERDCAVILATHRPELYGEIETGRFRLT